MVAGRAVFLPPGNTPYRYLAGRVPIIAGGQ